MALAALSAVPGRLPRSTAPTALPNATAFLSEPPSFSDPVQVINRVKGIAPLMRTLEEARINHGHGPARGSGNWALAYLAFVISAEPTMRPWLRRQLDKSALWKACGFAEVPAYSTLWERFCELEEHFEVFEHAAHYLVRLARKQDPEVGMWLAIDGTECQTHAQPKHNCGPKDDCPTRNKRTSAQFPKISADDAATRRQLAGSLTEAVVEAPQAPSSNGLVPVPNGQVQETAEGRRFASGGHWWLSRDHEAGGRAYKDKKAWHGYMCVKVTDVHTGAVIAARVIPAHQQEWSALERVYDAATSAIGTDPIALIGDRGYSMNETFDFCPQRGVTPVFPWRDYSQGKQPSAPPGPRWDRHGIPLCPHCGTPGDFLRFEAKGSARIWFRCSLRLSQECEKDFSIATSQAPRRLIPIWRTSEIYSTLRQQENACERVHQRWRERYAVAGKTLSERPRRVGLACQQLRASAALMVEWFWTTWRQGWIGGGGLRATARRLRPGARHGRLLKARQADGLFGGRYPLRASPGSKP